MKKLVTFLNYLTLFFFYFYLIFLLSRIIFERKSINPLILMGTLIICPLILWFLVFFCLFIIKVHKFLFGNLRKKEKEKDLSSDSNSGFVSKGFKLIALLKKATYNYHEYLKKTFLGFFLTNFVIFSKFSLKCVITFNQNRESIGKTLTRIGLFFWISTLIMFFLEIVLGGDFLILLYFLSLNLLIKVLIDIYLYIVIFENERLLDILETNYFPILKENVILNRFFMINFIIRDQFLLFINYGENDKKVKILLWKVFSEMSQHFVNLRIASDFVHSDWLFLKSLTQKINLIIFTNTFLILFVKEFLVLIDLFIVISIFFSSFLIFSFWLNFLDLRKRQESFVYRKYYEEINLLGLTHQNWLESAYTLLLNKGLTKSDIDLNFWLKRKSIEEFHDIRFEPFIDPLSKSERDFLISKQKHYFNWFFDELFSGRIDIENFDFDPDKPINPVNSTLMKKFLKIRIYLKN